MALTNDLMEKMKIGRPAPPHASDAPRDKGAEQSHACLFVQLWGAEKRPLAHQGLFLPFLPWVLGRRASTRLPRKPPSHPALFILGDVLFIGNN